MSDERSLTPVSHEDYEAIEAAVMETGRGRWFLREFARRNRHAETVDILATLARIEERLDKATQSGNAEHSRADEVLRLFSQAEAELGGPHDLPARVMEDMQATNAALADTLDALRAVANTLIAQDPQDRLAAAFARRLRALDAVAQAQAHAADRLGRYLETMDKAKTLLLALAKSDATTMPEQAPSSAVPPSMEETQDRTPAPAETNLPGQPHAAAGELISIQWRAIDKDSARTVPLTKPPVQQLGSFVEMPVTALSALPDGNDVAAFETVADLNMSAPAETLVPEDDIFVDEQDSAALPNRAAAGTAWAQSYPGPVGDSRQDSDHGGVGRDDDDPYDMPRHEELGRQIGVHSPALIRSLADLDRLTARERLALFS